MPRAAHGTTAALLAGTMARFEALPEAPVELRPLSAGEQCYVQFSSGSTRLPIGVDVRQDQLMANIDGSITRQELDENDSGVSWLPLYHDMGLIGFVLAPLCAQRSVDLLAPGDFARRPMQWLSLIARRRATITYSPSFGYDLVARRAQGQLPGDLDLSCLKIAGIGADMIQAPVLNRFAKTFAAAGFDARAFLPSYGMAEVCVGLSFGKRFGGYKLDKAGGKRDFVLCGRALPGHVIEIRDEEGTVLSGRAVGQLFVRGPSVMPGYFRQPDASALVLKDGWLATGDLGYWCDGELVVTGRAKDLIIVNGRNIWPQDIEWAIEALPRLRRGDACAFSAEAAMGEEVVVLVQGFVGEVAEREGLIGSIRQAVKETVGVDCRIELVSRQIGLPLTSSGKLSRSRAKARFMAGAYADVTGALPAGDGRRRTLNVPPSSRPAGPVSTDRQRAVPASTGAPCTSSWPVKLRVSGGGSLAPCLNSSISSCLRSCMRAPRASMSRPASLAWANRPSERFSSSLTWCLIISESTVTLAS